MSKIIQRTYESCRGKSSWAATGLFICALNGLCLAANVASTTDEQSSTLEPVVVTARRQNENLEKVPVAISALSQQDLAERKITSEADLESAVPGLTIRAATTSNDVSFSLRGQSAEPFSYTAPAVLTYFDEFGTAGTTTTAFYDLQSVQVVKGPQGTLFGRNATGGAVMYTSAPPTKDFEGYVNVTYGNFDEQKVEAAVNLPMSSVASLRVAGEFEKRNGYEDNLYLNLREGSVDDRNIRATLLLTPTDELQSSTVAQYGRSGGYSAGTKLVGAYPSGSTYNGNALNSTAATLYPPGNPAQIRFPQLAAFNGIEGFLAVQNGTRFWDIYNDQTSSHDAQTDVVVNKTTYAISDNLSVKNILGYNLVSTRDRPDVDGSPFQVIAVGVSTGVGGEGNENGYDYRTEQYSDELQLVGNLDGKRLNYIVGAYYSRESILNDYTTTVGADFPEPGGVEAVSDHFVNRDMSRALFFQSTYEILPGFHATVGYRETWETVRITAFAGDTFSTELGAPGSSSVSEDKPSWTLGLDYQLTDQAMIYVQQRGSWRVGGYNGTSIVYSPSRQVEWNQYKPETTTDVEIGFKYAGWLGSLPARINIAAYDQEVKDMQREVSIELSAETSNAKKARIDGVEIDAQLDLTSWLQWGADYAYTNARFTDGSATASDLTGAVHDIVLGPFGQSPKQTGSMYLRATHTLPDSLGQVVLRGDVYTQSMYFYSNLANTLTPNTTIGGYTLENARMEWNDIAGSRVHLAGFVRNLTNKQYNVGGFSEGALVGVNWVIPGLPRMYGLEVGVKF